jgi:DnaK suppressor protein
VNAVTEEKLEYFRWKLLQKQEWLNEMVYRSEQHARESDPSSQDTADIAVAAYTKEFMFGQSSIDHQVLQSISDALGRINNRSYGICEDCEEEIGFRRLEAVPWTRHCLRCQRLLETQRVADTEQEDDPVALDKLELPNLPS